MTKELLQTIREWNYAVNIDRMSPLWRALVNEYGMPAEELWHARTHAIPHMTAEQAAGLLGAEFGLPIVARRQKRRRL